MKTQRLTAVIASLLIGSAAATAAYAQTTPPATAGTSESSMSSGMSHNSMSNHSMSNNMSSDTVSRKVKSELTRHGVTATNVNVTFDNGTATLSGTVATKRDIKKAKSAAMRVRGVKHVDTSGLQVHARSRSDG